MRLATADRASWRTTPTAAATSRRIRRRPALLRLVGGGDQIMLVYETVAGGVRVQGRRRDGARWANLTTCRRVPGGAAGPHGAGDVGVLAFKTATGWTGCTSATTCPGRRWTARWPGARWWPVRSLPTPTATRRWAGSARRAGGCGRTGPRAGARGHRERTVDPWPGDDPSSAAHTAGRRAGRRRGPGGAGPPIPQRRRPRHPDARDRPGGAAAAVRRKPPRQPISEIAGTESAANARTPVPEALLEPRRAWCCSTRGGAAVLRSDRRSDPLMSPARRVVVHRRRRPNSTAKALDQAAVRELAEETGPAGPSRRTRPDVAARRDDRLQRSVMRSGNFFGPPHHPVRPRRPGGRRWNGVISTGTAWCDAADITDRQLPGRPCIRCSWGAGTPRMGFSAADAAEPQAIR